MPSQKSTTKRVWKATHKLGSTIPYFGDETLTGSLSDPKFEYYDELLTKSAHSTAAAYAAQARALEKAGTTDSEVALQSVVSQLCNEWTGKGTPRGKAARSDAHTMTTCNKQRADVCNAAPARALTSACTPTSVCALTSACAPESSTNATDAELIKTLASGMQRVLCAIESLTSAVTLLTSAFPPHAAAEAKAGDDAPLNAVPLDAATSNVDAAVKAVASTSSAVSTASVDVATVNVATVDVTSTATVSASNVVAIKAEDKPAVADAKPAVADAKPSKLTCHERYTDGEYTSENLLTLVHKCEKNGEPRLMLIMTPECFDKCQYTVHAERMETIKVGSLEWSNEVNGALLAQRVLSLLMHGKLAGRRLVLFSECSAAKDIFTDMFASTAVKWNDFPISCFLLPNASM